MFKTGYSRSPCQSDYTLIDASSLITHRGLLMGALIIPLLSRLYPIKKVGFNRVTFISSIYSLYSYLNITPKSNAAQGFSAINLRCSIYALTRIGIPLYIQVMPGTRRPTTACLPTYIIYEEKPMRVKHYFCLEQNNFTNRGYR